MRLFVVSVLFFVIMILVPFLAFGQPCPPIDVNLSMDEQAQTWWMVLLDFLVQISAPLVTAILGVLGTWVVRKLAKKWDVEKQEAVVRLMDGFVTSGVAFAEEQARKALKVGERQTDGAKKLQNAVEYVRQQTKASGIDYVVYDELVSLVESKLQQERSKPDGVIPSESVGK